MSATEMPGKMPENRSLAVEAREAGAPEADISRYDRAHTMAAGRAATELGLKRGEFELAVYLGAVRVTSGVPDGVRPRVHREEMERLRAQDGFPGALRERVRTVGTAEGAGLLGISPVRFTRLARAGCVTPVAFYLNRYRAVVWVYLAQEARALAARSPELLVGNSPPWLRDRLDGGGDCRPRNWRSRRIERLLALTRDPWTRAAIVARGLDPVQLAEVVDDPYERAYFGRVGPGTVFGRRGTAAGREAMARLMPADEPDEILWRRISLITELDAAREHRPAPRPGDRPWTGPGQEGAPVAAVEPVPAAEVAGPVESVPLAGSGGPGAAAAPGAPVTSCRAAGSEGPGGLLARLRLRGARGWGRRGLRRGAAAGSRRPARRRHRATDRGRAFAGREGGPAAGDVGNPG